MADLSTDFTRSPSGRGVGGPAGRDRKNSSSTPSAPDWSPLRIAFRSCCADQSGFSNKLSTSRARHMSCPPASVGFLVDEAEGSGGLEYPLGCAPGVASTK